MLVKPFKEYCDQVKLLQTRGMVIDDTIYAERKLSQVGYYRLSGFWHTARRPNNIDNSLSDYFLFPV